MKNQWKHIGWLVTIGALLLGALACGLPGPVVTPSGSGGSSTSGATISGGLAREGEPLSQWASSAYASSQYDSVDWSALQATGAPNTSECGDMETAWATSSSTGIDWIELSYPVAVIPTRIDIYHTFNPGAVVRIEVMDAQGIPHSAYETQASPIDACPTVQTIDLSQEGIDFQVAKVIVHLDQRNHTGWNEIDAVQLTGTP
jgi:hypothetical protein